MVRFFGYLPGTILGFYLTYNMSSSNYASFKKNVADPFNREMSKDSKDFKILDLMIKPVWGFIPFGTDCLGNMGEVKDKIKETIKDL